MVDIEKGRKFLDVGFGGLGLTIEDGCDGYFRAAELRRDGFEREVLLLLAFEECWRRGWKTGDEGGLLYC